MREEYLNRIEELKRELWVTENKFNCISGIDTNNKTIDALIMQMNGLEVIIDSIYIQAKANKIALN